MPRWREKDWVLCRPFKRYPCVLRGWLVPLLALSHVFFFPLRERSPLTTSFLSRCTSPFAQFLLRKNVMELWRDVHRTIRGVDDKDYVDFLTIQVSFGFFSFPTGCCRAAARFLLRRMNPWQDIGIHRALLRPRIPHTLFLLLHSIDSNGVSLPWILPPDTPTH